MLTCLVLLPPELVGTHVLSKLEVIDLVRLDSAVARKSCRAELDTAFKCTTVKLRYRQLHTEQQLRIWKWAVERSVILMNFCFHAYINDRKLLSGVARNLHRDAKVQWLCRVNPSTNAVAYAAIAASGILEKITHVNLSGLQSVPVMKNLCSKMTSLEEVNITEGDFTNELLACRPLKKIGFNFVPRCQPGLELVLSRHASTLHTLILTPTEMDSAAFRAVAGLSSLIVLCIHTAPHANDSADDDIVASGLIAVAQECQRLQSVDIEHRGLLSDSVLLTLATHCPQLWEIKLLGPVRLTDETLARLATNCPDLCRLSTVAWCVTSMDTVQAALSLFARLRMFRVSCAPDHQAPEAVATLAYALNRLERAEELRITGLTAGHSSLLSAVRATASLHTFQLGCQPGENLAMAACVMKVAASSSARQRTLEISLPYGSTAQSPQSVGTGCGITDTTIDVIAQHCHQLEMVNLTACATVSEAAVWHLLQQYRGLIHVTPPLNFSTEARQRLDDALFNI